jgi:hypothetical protein
LRFSLSFDMLDANAREKIVEFCASRSHGTYHISIPVDSTSLKIFVKSGYSSLVPEARTQEYVFALAKSDPQAPGVPEVHDIIHHSNRTYLVMEDVPVLSFNAWIEQEGISAEERNDRLAIATVKVAGAVSWLLTCPIPGDGKIGPIGGGLMQHEFFRNEEAGLEFFTLQALEAYVNEAGFFIPPQYIHLLRKYLIQALSRLPRRPGRSLRTVTFANERLLIGHSDINLDNFLYDPLTGKVWMVDYQHVNVLPESFVSFAMHFNPSRFGEAVAEMVDFPRSTKLEVLELAAIIVMQSGNGSFGGCQRDLDDICMLTVKVFFDRSGWVWESRATSA